MISRQRWQTFEIILYGIHIVFIYIGQIGIEGTSWDVFCNMFSKGLLLVGIKTKTWIMMIKLTLHYYEHTIGKWTWFWNAIFVIVSLLHWKCLKFGNCWQFFCYGLVNNSLTFHNPGRNNHCFPNTYRDMSTTGGLSKLFGRLAAEQAVYLIVLILGSICILGTNWFHIPYLQLLSSVTIPKLESV